MRKLRAFSLDSIGPTIEERAIAVLINILREPSIDKELRIDEAKALGKIGAAIGKRKLTALIDLLQDSNINRQQRGFIADILFQMIFDLEKEAVQQIAAIDNKHI